MEEIDRPMKLFFVEYTSPNADDGLAPIIFLHGLMGSNRSWNKVKFQISERTKRKLFLLDLRNHGQSEWCDETRLKYYTIDLENFMKSKNIPKAVFVGHSLGARVAIMLAFKRPVMVEKLVVEDTALEISDDVVEEYSKYIGFYNTLTNSSGLLPPNLTLVETQKKILLYLQMKFPQFFRNVSAANISGALPFHLDKSGKIIWEFNFDTMLALKEDMSKLEIDLAENPVYQGDLLLIGGEKSKSLKETDVYLFEKHFPNCQSHFFENGYHVLHLEFPEKYIKLVSKFISE